MFRKDLQDKLHKIFGLKKTTFEAPSTEFEQDTLFIEVQECRSRTTQGKAFSKVTGNLVTFSQQNKLPYGFFNKKIEQADAVLKKDLFFFNMDQDVPTSDARVINICERRTSFVFLYSAQYDPNQGSMTSIQLDMQFESKLIDIGDGSHLDIGDGKVLGV